MLLGSAPLGSTVIGGNFFYVDGIPIDPPVSSGIATFDAVNKRIILTGTVASIEAVYTDWQAWLLLDTNSSYDSAFRLTGGDTLGGGLSIPFYYFLTNGWRIRPMESNQILTFIGNLFVDGGGDDAIVPTLGNYNVLAKMVVPIQAQGIATSGTTISVTEIANAVWTAPISTMTSNTTIGGYIAKVLLSIPKFLGLK